MNPFSTSWKHQKTVRFSDVFRGQRKGALGANALRLLKELLPLLSTARFVFIKSSLGSLDLMNTRYYKKCFVYIQ